MNKIRTDACQICSFASKSISFSEKQFRCEGLYNIVKYPISNIKQSLKAFLLQLKINYRDIKVKRSFSIIGIILQNNNYNIIQNAYYCIQTRYP